MDHQIHKNTMVKEFIVFSKYFIPDSAGREINMYETYNNLCQLGWKTTIYTSKSTHTQKNILSNSDKYGNIQIKRYREIFYCIPLWITKINFNNKIICFHGTEYCPDVLIYLYILALKILGKKNFLVVFSSHGLFSLRYQYDSGIAGVIKRLIDKIIVITLLNNIVDGYRAVSEWEASFMKKSGIKNITSIHNGLPMEAMKNYKLENEDLKLYGDYLIQVGRVDKSKNYEMVIKALPYLKNRHLNYLIVGPIDDLGYKKSLDRLINQLNLSHRVLFLGVITGKLKYLLLKNSKIYIQISKSEGFGNTTNEAMSQGCCCIVSRNTSLSEIIVEKKNGFLVDINDFRDLAYKINYILDKSNSSIINQIKIHNKKTSRLRSWKQTSLEIENFIKHIINDYNNKNLLWNTQSS